jgi:alpha/beta hydrolase family protein
VLHSSAPKNRTIVRSQRTLRLTRAALQAAFVLSEDLGAGLAERLFTSPRRHPRPERERAAIARGRELDVEVVLRSPRRHGERVRIAAWRWGHGPTALLVHGWEGRGSQLAAFVDPLVAAGMSVVAFDAPAHGDSPGTRLYLTDYADAIADVIAAVGPVHATIAHSFGAAALLVAGSRNGVDVPRNVMIAPNALVDDAVRRFANVVGLDDPERLALERGLAAASGMNLDSLRLDRLALAAGRTNSLLVVHDREDREVPVRHGDRLAAAWPGAELKLTDGLGHRRILRDRAVIEQIVAFARVGIRPPVSDLVREVDRQLG